MEWGTGSLVWKLAVLAFNFTGVGKEALGVVVSGFGFNFNGIGKQTLGVAIGGFGFNFSGMGKQALGVAIGGYISGIGEQAFFTACVYGSFEHVL